MNTLIERLRDHSTPKTRLERMNLCSLASDALEAKDAEIAEVKGFWKEAQRRNRSLLEENADLALLADQYKAERDQLQAKLDALQKQKPVAYGCRTADGVVRDCIGPDALMEYETSYTVKLFAAPVVASQPLTIERKEAMAIYTPPFNYQHGYIFDAQHKMVADDDKVEETVAARIRGWGKLSYLPNCAAIQDELGQVVADALTAYYAAHNIGGQP